MYNTKNHPGRRIELEAKAPGKTPTKIQWNKIKYWKKYGAITGWFDNLDDLKIIMNKYL